MLTPGKRARFHVIDAAGQREEALKRLVISLSISSGGMPLNRMSRPLLPGILIGGNRSTGMRNRLVTPIKNRDQAHDQNEVRMANGKDRHVRSLRLLALPPLIVRYRRSWTFSAGPFPRSSDGCGSAHGHHLTLHSRRKPLPRRREFPSPESRCGSCTVPDGSTTHTVLCWPSMPIASGRHRHDLAPAIQRQRGFRVHAGHEHTLRDSAHPLPYAWYACPVRHPPKSAPLVQESPVERRNLNLYRDRQCGLVEHTTPRQVSPGGNGRLPKLNQRQRLRAELIPDCISVPRFAYR